MQVLVVLVPASDDGCSEIGILGRADIGGGTRVADCHIDPHVLVFRGPVRDELVQHESVALAVGEARQGVFKSVLGGVLPGSLHHLVEGGHYQVVAGL